MDPLVNFERSALAKVLAAQIARVRNGIVAVQAFVPAQVRQLLEDAVANLAPNGRRISMVGFVVDELRTAFEAQIAEFALGFLDDGVVLGRVAQHLPVAVERPLAVTALGLGELLRRNALKAVLFQQWFDSEALEADLAGEGALSAVNSSMFNESYGFFEATATSLAFKWRILRVSSLMLQQTGRFVEDFPTYFAHVLNLSCVNVLVTTKGAQQRVGILTKATLIPFHSINDDDLGGNPLALHLGHGHLVRLLLFSVSPLMGLASYHGNKPFAAVNALDGLLRLLVRRQVLVQQPDRRYDDRWHRFALLASVRNLIDVDTEVVDKRCHRIKRFRFTQIALVSSVQKFIVVRNLHLVISLVALHVVLCRKLLIAVPTDEATIRIPNRVILQIVLVKTSLVSGSMNSRRKPSLAITTLLRLGRVVLFKMLVQRPNALQFTRNARRAPKGKHCRVLPLQMVVQLVPSQKLYRANVTIRVLVVIFILLNPGRVVRGIRLLKPSRLPNLPLLSTSNLRLLNPPQSNRQRNIVEIFHHFLPFDTQQSIRSTRIRLNLNNHHPIVILRFALDLDRFR